MKRLLVVLAVFVLAGCNGNLIVTPKSGTIINASTITVTGELGKPLVPGGTLKVNGIATPINGDGTWTQVIPASPVGKVTVVEAIYTQLDGHVKRQRTAVVNGPSLAPGQFSPDGVGMVFTNNGLANLGPVINNLAGASFDISGLILAQRPLIQPTDAGLGVSITGSAYEAGSSSVGITTNSTSTGVATKITVKDLYIGLDVQLSGLISGPCKLELLIPTTTIDAKFDLKPDAADPSMVDVNQVGTPTVNTAGVSYEFISGKCDPSSFIIGSIINSAAGGAIEGTVKNGFQSQLGDPDGNGPQDAPIAAAIQTALTSVSIAGPVGEAVGAHLNAPFTSITETNTGIDFRANADFFATKGTGPGDCDAPPGSPEFSSTFNPSGVYPTLGGTTPGGQPYGLGLAISSSAFNQMLGAMTECGLLSQDITEIALGTGAPAPITSTLLSLLVPAFATLPANTPVVIKLEPKFAPFLGGPAGPNGEMAELTLADLQVRFVTPGNVTQLLLGVDAPLGFDLAFDSAAGQLAPAITAPLPAQVTARVLDNALGVNEPNVEALFPNLFPAFVGGLGDSFAAFPLPAFLGLQLDVAEVARQGNSYVLYANLNPAPVTQLKNVAFTDLSTPDYNNDSCCFDSWEWRHRLRNKVSSDKIEFDLKGMMGADACCTVDDERDSAHAGGRIAFDVVPANGETWKVDLSHLIKGAHTTVGEGVGGGYGAQTWITPVTGRYKVGSGGWVSFNFSPSILTPGWRNSHSNYEFTGSAATSVTGTTTQRITVEFGFDVEAFSDSNWAFPAEAGNEAAVRLGANDSLTNNFTAGDYPGAGNRNIAGDGYKATVVLTTVG